MPKTIRNGKKVTTNRGVIGKKMTPRKPRVYSGSKMQDLQSKPDSWIECREMRHSMNRIGYFHWNDLGKRAICRVSVCIRCGTVRHSFFYASGKPMDSRYEYPDGYLLNGNGTVSHAEVVLESMRRCGIAADIDSIMTATPSRNLRSVGA